MDREEKQFEQSIERLISYTEQIKISLIRFLSKLDHDQNSLNWPSVLDSFSVLCGQINNLMNRARESQSISNRVLLPRFLSPDPDQELIVLTEGRVQAFNHEMVPDYLRTKPDLDIEEYNIKNQEKAKSLTIEMGNKQVAVMNKLTDNIISHIKSHRADTDHEVARIASAPSYTASHTNEIIAAICHGQIFKTGPQASTQPLAGGAAGITTGGGDQRTKPPAMKAPQIRTNIKTAPSNT